MYVASHLNFCNVAVDDPQNPSFVQVTLKASTMDPFHCGVQDVIGSTQYKLCPVATLLAYLAVCEDSPGAPVPFQGWFPFDSARVCVKD